MPTYFPLFLNLEDKPCLVVGGGKVATPKVDDLLQAGARITLVAPQVSPALQRHINEGRINWVARRFRESDLADRFLVLAATDDPVLHQHIHRLAEAANLLFNAVDEPASCNYIFAAIARSGPLQVAVSSAGTSPTLAGRLRDRIRDTLLGPQVGRLAQWLGRRRQTVKSRPDSYLVKRDFWRAVLDSPIPHWLDHHQHDRAQAHFDQLLTGLGETHEQVLQTQHGGTP